MTSSLAPDPATGPRARTTFEWLTGKRLLIQRWEVDLAEAPDGIAIIGADRARSAYVQHYFDTRGVARIYEMAFADRHWTLQRIASVPDFSQPNGWQGDRQLTHCGVQGGLLAANSTCGVVACQPNPASRIAWQTTGAMDRVDRLIRQNLAKTPCSGPPQRADWTATYTPT
jgi:hypothetical protein